MVLSINCSTDRWSKKKEEKNSFERERERKEEEKIEKK